MQRCQVCVNEHIKDINKRIVRGENLSKLSQEYGVSYDSMYNHSREHVPRQLRTGAEVVLKNHGLNVMTELDRLMSETREILTEARDNNHNGIALKAIQQLRGNLALVAAIQNEIFKQQQGDGLSKDELAEYRKQKDMNDRLMSSISKTLSPLELEIYRELNLKIISENKGWSKIKGIDYSLESEVMEEKRKREEKFDDPRDDIQDRKTPRSGKMMRRTK